MENSPNIPSSPFLPCFHILQTSHWRAHLFLFLASIWWRARTVAKALCELSLLEVPVCLSGYVPKQWPQGVAAERGVRGTLTAAQPQSLMSRLHWAAQPLLPHSTLPGPSPNLLQQKSLTEQNSLGFFSLRFSKDRSSTEAPWVSGRSPISYSKLPKKEF